MLTQFRSPQLLMVSGIGPEETLKGLKIPVVSHLRGVGQNLAVVLPSIMEYFENLAYSSRINHFLAPAFASMSPRSPS